MSFSPFERCSRSAPQCAPHCFTGISSFNFQPDPQRESDRHPMQLSSQFLVPAHPQQRVGMASPVPRAPTVKVTRKVFSSAAMSMSFAALGCCAMTVNSPKMALVANPPGNHWNAARNIQRITRNSDPRLKQLHDGTHC